MGFDDVCRTYWNACAIVPQCVEKSPPYPRMVTSPQECIQLFEQC